MSSDDCEFSDTDCDSTLDLQDMTPANASYPQPKGGASLLLSFRLQQRTMLIIGGGTLAATRAFSALEADSNVVVVTNGGLDASCDELKWRAQHGQLEILDSNSLPSSCSGESKACEAIESYLKSVPGISLVCVTDTVQGLKPSSRRSNASASQIYDICKARGIPVNVTDIPELCDFSFASTHRFVDFETGGKTPLQVGVTTNGQGCRLAGRIKREIAARLPKEAGGAVEKVGRMRVHAKECSGALSRILEGTEDTAHDEINEDGPSTPNRPVPQRSLTETDTEKARRRMKWVAQVSEYWPLQRLASMTETEMSGVLNGEAGLNPRSSLPPSPTSPHHDGSIHYISLAPTNPPGKILLVGSGPGHPSLLTIATRNALTRHANLVLSDKLVPAAVLALIPPEVEVRIARKFPGNAEASQNEMMEAAVEAAKRGLTVVRLKQGDPVVYGRTGEEVLYFRAHGFEPIVIPGVSSALAAPTFAGIPVTQRGVAESFIVCTGVGRAGKDVRLPGYDRPRTLVILMGVARLPQVVFALTESLDGDPERRTSRRDGAAYPPHLPIALIERASMPDQRVIASTLRDIEAALDSVGEQRPPGMLVIGWSVLALYGKGDTTVLDDDAFGRDGERVIEWLGGDSSVGWRVTEGLEAGWETL